jgi:hypothetical protein
MSKADLWVFVGVTVYVGGLAFDIAASIEEKVTFWGHVYLLGV